MKKLLLIVLTVSLSAILFVACQKKAVDEIVMDEAAAIEKSSEMITAIINLEMKTVVDNMAPAVKVQLTEDALLHAWHQSSAAIGEIKSKGDVSVTENNLYFSVETIIEGEASSLKITLSFDDKALISGIWFAPVSDTSILEDTETYVQREISIGEHSLTGIWTIPKYVQYPPVVIMIQGSGPSDYDETVSVNKPFRDISNALAEQGISTVRFNKRFFQKPQLAKDTSSVTIYTEYIDDVNAAISFAQENVGENIYLLGHSLGGMSVFKIAQDNPLVKGVISLAGTPRGLDDLIFDQNVMAINAMDSTKAQKDLLIKTAKKYLDEVKALKEDNGSAPFGISALYWLSLKDLDTLNISKKLTIPMLILQGSADFQVYANKDFALWQRELSDNKNAQLKLYDGLNHLFMPSNSNGDIINITEYDTKGTVDKAVTDDIAHWINNGSI